MSTLRHERIDLPVLPSDPDTRTWRNAMFALFATSGLNATLPKQFWDEVTLQVSPAIAAVSTLLFIFIAVLIFAAEGLRRRAAAR